MNFKITKLNHIGILADDLQKSADFYVNYLGFNLIYKKEIGPVSCWFLTNEDIVLELVNREMPEAGPIGPIYHISLEVDDIDSAVNELKSKGIIDAGAKINSDPTFFDTGIMNIFFNAPGGERIELFQYGHK